MEITIEYKEKVIKALLEKRKLFGGTDGAFAKQYEINQSVFSLLKKGQTDGNILRESKWLELGRLLEVNNGERQWNIARTEVFAAIEDDITTCQRYAKAMIYVDDPEIRKSFTAKYLSRTRKNCFYIDCSQCKSKSKFIKTLARTIGVENKGTYADVKDNIKEYLRMLDTPIVILDEAGDLSYSAFLDLKEYWNATEGVCGWYMMGADGLRTVINSGINRSKVGYREIFSRYSSKYLSLVPHDRAEKAQFYRKLITDVLSVNVADKSVIPNIVNHCLIDEKLGFIGGLRRAETKLLLLRNHAA